MNGTEHYQEAERLLWLAEGDAPSLMDYRVAAAQVHATLALTAAAELGTSTRNACESPITDPWREVRCAADTSAECDPLADVAAVLDVAPGVRVTEVLAGLAALNPSAYRGWTVRDLSSALPDAAKPYKSNGCLRVAADRVRAALDARAIRRSFGLKHSEVGR